MFQGWFRHKSKGCCCEVDIFFWNSLVPVVSNLDTCAQMNDYDALITWEVQDSQVLSDN